MTSEQPDASAASDGAVQRSLGPDASRHTGPRVLVVDDDANIRQMLLDALDDAGFVTREAQHGAEAMSVVQDWHPDVILLDLVMPWMNGYEFADAYRQAPGPPRTDHRGHRCRPGCRTLRRLSRCRAGGA